MNLLVTGGAGFIGSNFVKLVIREHPDIKVTVLDALTYAGNLKNFSEDIRGNKNFSFIHGNILDKELVFDIMRNQDKVVHFAAYTHIDRSIDLSDPFIDTDFRGTHILLEAIRKYPVEKFIHISTSEVYGSAQYIPMDEKHPLCPQSPYAAAKAGADRLVYSYWFTYHLPVTIIRPFNNYGPNQYPEKLIPLFITNTIEDKKLPIYGTGENRRDWLWVSDCAEGVYQALEKETIGKVINLGTGSDISVNEIAKTILRYFGKPYSLMEYVGDRPGHVKRLCASNKRAKSMLGWSPKISFKEGIKHTIEWYIKNDRWWREIKERKEFKDFEERWYGSLRGN